MNKELCFNIENEQLYLEQVLVDYNDVPIFFLCKGATKYYICLCVDINDLNYIVAQLSLQDVYDLLHGKIPMRDVFFKQKTYWSIISGDEIDLDVITEKNINTLDKNLLPDKNACFKILTNQIKTFVQDFDEKNFVNRHSSKSNNQETINNFTPNNIDSDLFIELLSVKTNRRQLTKNILYNNKYNEKMKSIKKEETTISTKQINCVAFNKTSILIAS